MPCEPAYFSKEEAWLAGVILCDAGLTGSDFNDHYDRLSYHQATSRTDTDKEKE